MSRSRKQISEEFKLSVIRDYYSSGMSKSACRRKYQLSSPMMLNSWLKKYGNKENVVPLQTESDEEEMANRKQTENENNVVSLSSRTNQPGLCVSSMAGVSTKTARLFRLCLLIQYDYKTTVYYFS